MRKLCLALCITAVLLCGCDRVKQITEPGAARFYRDYRRDIVYEDVRNIVELNEHSLIDTRIAYSDITRDNGAYTLEGKETTRWMPPNAAALNFATTVTRELYAVVEKIDGEWQVVDEQVLSEEISFSDER